MNNRLHNLADLIKKTPFTLQLVTANSEVTLQTKG